MDGFLEKIKPYSKHNIFTKIYEIDRHGVVKIPKSAKWIVLNYIGYKDGKGIFKEDGKGIVALILNDEENQFLPVISFLTREEVVELALQLLKVVGAYGVKVEEVDSDG